MVKCLFCRKASKQCNSFIFNIERNLISEFSMLNLIISERTKNQKVDWWTNVCTKNYLISGCGWLVVVCREGIHVEILFYSPLRLQKTEHLGSPGPGPPREANYDGKISAQAQISSYQICLKCNFSSAAAWWGDGSESIKFLAIF